MFIFHVSGVQINTVLWILHMKFSFGLNTLQGAFASSPPVKNLVGSCLVS